MRIAEKIPSLYNAIIGNPLTGSVFKNIMGIAGARKVPKVAKCTVKKWYQSEFKRETSEEKNLGEVYFFCDEFTNYQDAEIGKKAIMLLDKLGYWVEIPPHMESGRTWLSKGFLKEAKKIINKNIEMLSGSVGDDRPIVGLEPSAILSFRDEYTSLCSPEHLEKATALAKNALLIEEFLLKEMKEGKVSGDSFSNEEKLIKLHGHCHQKALSSMSPTKQVLQIPQNYRVQMIPSGCCGMAGSFGYEKEHYELSMNIGELVLFPAVREQPENVEIAAPGTSCRHQIADGTGRIARHPVELLWDALK